MRSFGLFFVHLSPAARAAALPAARSLFPGAESILVDTIEEAVRHKESGDRELLVLANSGPGEVAQAIQALDEDGLPRWAVAAMGSDAGDLAETVPPEYWQTPLLAQAFRSALAQHELQRENLSLRGDLKSIARRISHDLYTPIGCIHTSASVLKILPPEDTQSAASIIQNIEDSSVEISQLVDRVSFVLKATAEPSIPVTVDMDEVITHVLRSLETAIQKTGATVVPPASWPRATGVPGWLKVIWFNLISNALKHGGPAIQITLGWSPKSQGHRFWVADSGSGIRPEFQSGLFRPFNQLHTVRTNGLGLSIVQRLIALQGGVCGYQERPEGGSLFYFVLPD